MTRTGLLAQQPRIHAAAPLRASGSDALCQGIVSKDNPDKSNSKSQDVALVYGRSEAGLHILRQRKDRLEKGVIRPLQEGKPIDGEVVRLKQRAANVPVYDVEVQYEGTQTPLAGLSESSRGHGPAQVATDQYRDNWDLVFRHRREPEKKLLN